MSAEAVTTTPERVSQGLSPAAIWGVLGVVLLLASGVYRVLPWALEPLHQPETMGTLHWLLYGGSVIFNGFMEGYRGFQLGVVPRVLARARHLSEHPNARDAWLAPLFCAGFYGMERRALIARYILLFGIIGVIVAMRFVPQPWRGIVDAGVVVGLGWGCIALLFGLLRAIQGYHPQADPRLPAGER